MRVLVLSTAHPNDPAVFGRCVRRLVELDWDVIYVAPFADFGVRPPPGLTGLDIAVHRGERHVWRSASRVLTTRGREVDLIIVSPDDLLSLVPRDLRTAVQVIDASRPRTSDQPQSVRSLVAGRGGSSSIPLATESAVADPDQNAIHQGSHATTPEAFWRAGVGR
jgi:hypothetical protein